MWDGFNNRKFPRLKLNCSIKLIIQNQEKEISATTENVGMGGVCVVLKEPLERFNQCSLELILPTEQKLKSKAKVAWVIHSKEPGPKGSTYDTGFEFLKLETDDKELLAKVLEGASEAKFKDL